MKSCKKVLYGVILVVSLFFFSGNSFGAPPAAVDPLRDAYASITQDDANAIFEGINLAASLKSKIYSSNGLHKSPLPMTDLQALKSILQTLAASSRRLSIEGNQVNCTKWANRFVIFIDAVFLGNEFPTSFGFLNPAFFNNPKNDFGDSGFYSQYRDYSGNQVFHTMSYVKIAFWFTGGMACGANHLHERRDGGASKQDWYAGEVGLEMGDRLRLFKLGQVDENGVPGRDPSWIADNIDKILGTDEYFNDGWPIFTAGIPEAPATKAGDPTPTWTIRPLIPAVTQIVPTWTDNLLNRFVQQ
ncbi:MAG: hypothetical protein HQM10_05000 [Candidatus Riflebacteria bacterium]|nr:hypothetical protein [Candidatus Riflebacteria bacterium]